MDNIKQLLNTFMLLVWLSLSFTTQAAEQIVYLHPDALGSPVAATDESGNLLWRESYRPYGERVQNTDNGDNEQWYTGKIFDEETQLSYFGARYYDPVVGRFMGIDPVAFQEDNIHSFNRYAYANNNPYRYIDPNGESPIDIGFLVFDGIKLAVAINSGVGVSQAAGDFAASLVGVVSPIPGVGQAIKAGRIASKATKVVKPRIKVKDITDFGSKVRNFEIDKTKSQFEKHLRNNGFGSTTSKDGKVSIFSKNGQKEFTTREFSKSTDGPSGEIFRDNKLNGKIRFKEE